MVEFARTTSFDSLPPEVVAMGRDLLIDSIGCALGGHGVTKGKAAIAMTRDFGAGDDVTIIGGKKASLFGGSFANGELMNAIDMDSVVVPGHVTPYVVPPVMSAAEITKASGKELIRANVLAHEVACRVAGAYTALRTKRVIDGETRFVLSDATGYGSTIVGGAIGAGLLLKLDAMGLQNCFGIAAYQAPVPALAKYLRLPYSPTVKYTSAGWVAAGSVLAARLAAAGYTGDREVLEGEYGFWRMFASDICDWNFMFGEIGKRWIIATAEFKPYPSFRMGHPGVEAFVKLLESEKLKPEDIDRIDVRTDPVSASPVYLNREIRSHSDAYIAWSYVLAVSSLYPPGPAWQSPEALNDPRVKALAAKVNVKGDWSKTADRTSRSDIVSHPVEVVVQARGKKHVANLMPYPKGHPKRPLTEKEFDGKFLHNSGWRFTAEKSAALLKTLKGLAGMPNTAPLFAQLAE